MTHSSSSRRPVLLGAGALIALVAAPAFAGSNLKDSLRFGTHVLGPDLKVEDLAGRVVLIEDWGIH
jgi:hypothetical protein